MKLLKIGLLLLGLIIIYLFAVREKAPSAITPSPSPAPIVVIPTIGLAPTSQRLIINWNSLTFGTPEKLPFFTITAPLIDSQSISVIAATLGFSDNDLKPSLKTTSRFYVKNNLSLFASTVQNQVLFNAITPLPTKQGFASPAVLQQKAETYLRQFFTGQSFFPAGTDYFFGSSADYYPQKVTPNKANLVRLSYRQELNGYPLLTTSAKNAIVSFTFDSNQILRSLEISGGFNTTEAGSQLALLDFNALKIQGPRLAVLLSLETTVDNKSLIDNQLSVTFDLDSLELIYFAKPDDRQIIPVFLLSGILKGSFPDTPATYLVPAARP